MVAQDPTAWPRDQAEFLFLGSAADLLGRAYFGDQWTGNETRVQLLIPLPAWSHVKEDRRSRTAAHELLSAVPGYIACPLIQKLPTSFAALGADRAKPAGEICDYDFSEGQWNVARQLRAKQIEDNAAAGSRLGKVRSDLVALFTAGHIRTGLRPKKAADVGLLRPNVWSVVNVSNVFNSGQIHPDDPSSLYFSGDRFQWVFVSRGDLEQCIASLQEEDEQISDPEGIEREVEEEPSITGPTQLGLNRRRAREFFEAKPRDEVWPGLKDEMKALKMISECAGLSRAAVDQIRREVANARGVVLPGRGRPKKIPAR